MSIIKYRGIEIRLDSHFRNGHYVVYGTFKENSRLLHESSLVEDLELLTAGAKKNKNKRVLYLEGL